LPQEPRVVQVLVHQLPPEQPPRGGQR
jgi:hypothetical protein